MRLKKFAAGAAALVLSTVLIAGCGDKEKKADDPAETAETSSTGAAPAADLTKDDFIAFSEAAQAAGSAHFTMTMSGAASITAEGDQVIGKSAGDSAMSLTMSMAGNKVEMRLVDKVMYMNMGQGTQNEFIKLDLTDTSNPLVAQFGSILDRTDIGQQMEQFGEIVSGVKATGKTEKIDGVDAKAYEMTIDGKKAAELAGQDASAISDSLTYTVYIGPDDLIRRLTMDIQGQSIQMDYSKWGEKVSIEKPKDSEISDADFSKAVG